MDRIDSTGSIAVVSDESTDVGYPVTGFDSVWFVDIMISALPSRLYDRIANTLTAHSQGSQTKSIARK